MKPMMHPETVTAEKGGWCCSQCGHVLNHAERLGRRQNNHFVFTGYSCKQCGHEWRNPKYLKMIGGRRTWTITMIHFDWTAIPFSNGKSYGGGSAPFSEGGVPVYA